MDSIIRQGTVIAALILMFSPSAVAGYSDLLHAVDENVTDCGDWSMISNSCDTSLRQHHYWFSRGAKNQRVMWDPATWGLPADTVFHSAGGRADDVSWAYLYLRGFKHTLIDEEGLIYTDDPCSVDYAAGYCKYDGFTTQYYRTYAVDDVCVVDAADGVCTVQDRMTFRCMCEDDRRSDVTTLTESFDYALWTSPEDEVSVTVRNCSGRVYLLSVDMPGNLTGVRISTGDGHYEKHDYYMSRSISVSGFEHMTLRRHTFEDSHGLEPVGKNLFASREPIQNVSIRLYTPFKTLNATVIVTTEEEQKESKHIPPALLFNIVLYGAIMFLLVRNLVQ